MLGFKGDKKNKQKNISVLYEFISFTQTLPELLIPQRCLCTVRNPVTVWRTLSLQVNEHADVVWLRPVCDHLLFIPSRQERQKNWTEAQTYANLCSAASVFYNVPGFSVHDGFSRRTSSIFPKPKALSPVVTSSSSSSSAPSCLFLRSASPDGRDAESRNPTAPIRKPPVAVEKTRRFR